MKVEIIHRDVSGRAPNEQHKYVIVAREGDELLGSMSIRLYRNVADVANVKVEPEHQRKGVARAMYKKLYEWADEERVYVMHHGLTEQGRATVDALRREGVIPRRRKLNEGADDDSFEVFLQKPGSPGMVARVGKERGRPVRDGISKYVSPASVRYVLYEAGEPISVLHVVKMGPDDAVIANVYTTRAHRRKGYARVLLERARKDFRLSHNQHLTEDGQGWSTAVGNPIATARKLMR